jgi:hypothetical protein
MLVTPTGKRLRGGLAAATELKDKNIFFGRENLGERLLEDVVCDLDRRLQSPAASTAESAPPEDLPSREEVAMPLAYTGAPQLAPPQNAVVSIGRHQDFSLQQVHRSTPTSGSPSSSGG